MKENNYNATLVRACEYIAYFLKVIILVILHANTTCYNTHMISIHY